MDTAPTPAAEVTRIIMDMPTKEALYEAMVKQNIEQGTEFLFYATVAGGCYGPPCVQVRERKSPTEISPVYANLENEMLAEPIEKQVGWGKFFKTTAVAYIEKNRIYYPSFEQEYVTEPKKKFYYYRNYTNIDALAKTLIRVLRKQFNVKVV